MSRQEREPVIIHNLDLDRVTWAITYCTNARKAGMKTSSSVGPEDKSAVFIGDDIALDQLACLKRSGYFMGACEGGEQERDNILNTDVTFLVSSTEVAKVNRLLGISDTDKLTVTGFPIDVGLLERYATRWEDKIDRSVCFLGETRPEKNPEFELEVAKLLIQSGYNCYHFSPTYVSLSDRLSDLGVTVVEELRGNQYYNRAALMQYVVCCSKRESLYVSGIETAVMGSVPIVPNNQESGYVDWCPRELMYDYPIAESVLYLIRHFGADKVGVVNTDYYHNSSYFDRLREAMEMRHG